MFVVPYNYSVFFTKDGSAHSSSLLDDIRKHGRFLTATAPPWSPGCRWYKHCAAMDETSVVSIGSNPINHGCLEVTISGFREYRVLMNIQSRSRVEGLQVSECRCFPMHLQWTLEVNKK